MKNTSFILAGLFVGIGLIVIGICLNRGLQSFSNKERVVTVKGLAEKNIKASEVKIILTSEFSGDFPKELSEKIEQRVNILATYLKEKGYDNYKVEDLNIYDSKTYYDREWDGKEYKKVKKDRYRASRNVVFQTQEVEKAENTRNTIDLDLINRELSSEVTCVYIFPELNSIKPELIAESTRNARLAGEQFAKDSQSKLGKIKTASQGQISLAGHYYSEDGVSSAPEEPFLQKARVVSTIVFFLED
ncbi:MAG: SIMPL domain-containing protein [Bacteroidales bacterium]|nr:SIMPL domain-containing protein [Bacteroidales bacterium]